MSVLLFEGIKENGIRTVVQTVHGKTYAVDTALTPDRGPETMVFRWNKKKQMITKWESLYDKNFSSMEEAYEHHNDVIRNLEEYLYPNFR